jgi:hypothetical protein
MSPRSIAAMIQFSSCGPIGMPSTDTYHLSEDAWLFWGGLELGIAQVSTVVRINTLADIGQAELPPSNRTGSPWAATWATLILAPGHSNRIARYVVADSLATTGDVGSPWRVRRVIGRCRPAM